MIQDPWSRPTVDDLRKILEGIGKAPGANERSNERLELSVPAEIRTQRGNTISAMTREISRTGIGLLHRGSVSPGDVVVRMASDTREFQYNVRIEWCTPCENGMFMSGGCFLIANEK
jgi:PilZ domain